MSFAKSGMSKWTLRISDPYIRDLVDKKYSSLKKKATVTVVFCDLLNFAVFFVQTLYLDKGVLSLWLLSILIIRCIFHFLLIYLSIKAHINHLILIVYIILNTSTLLQVINESGLTSYLGIFQLLNSVHSSLMLLSFFDNFLMVAAYLIFMSVMVLFNSDLPLRI